MKIDKYINKTENNERQESGSACEKAGSLQNHNR